MLYVIYRFSKLIDILPGVVDLQTEGQVIGKHFWFLILAASAAFSEGDARDSISVYQPYKAWLYSIYNAFLI